MIILNRTLKKRQTTNQQSCNWEFWNFQRSSKTGCRNLFWIDIRRFRPVEGPNFHGMNGSATPSAAFWHAVVVTACSHELARHSWLPVVSGSYWGFNSRYTPSERLLFKWNHKQNPNVLHTYAFTSSLSYIYIYIPVYIINFQSHFPMLVFSGIEKNTFHPICTPLTSINPGYLCWLHSNHV